MKAIFESAKTRPYAFTSQNTAVTAFPLFGADDAVLGAPAMDIILAFSPRRRCSPQSAAASRDYTMPLTYRQYRAERFRFHIFGRRVMPIS